MKEEFSAGGVVFKIDEISSNAKILLCYQKKLSGHKTYCLPKGHIEDGETVKAAAIREVFEETGVRAEIIAPLPDVTYFFMENGETIKKKVAFFLMKMITQDFKPNEETESLLWCDEKEATTLDKYPSEINVIKVAFKLLAKHNQLLQD